MKKLIIAAGTLVLLLILSETARAKDVDLEKIVITPSKTEESLDDISRKVDVITSEDIEASRAGDLAQVLDSITSVNISNYGSLGATKTIRMRGSSAAQVLVLMDGRPVNNPRDGEVELSNISLENVDRIEVMHGPGSSLYGAGAMGGTINIITKGIPKEKQKTEFTTSIGTFRTFIERLSYSTRGSGLGCIFTGEYKRSEGFRDNSGLDAKDLNAKFEYEFDRDNHLILNSGFYRSKVGAPGGITQPDIDDKEERLNSFFDLDWSVKPDDSQELSTKIYQSYDRLEFIENSAGSMFDTAFKKDIHTTKARGIDVRFSKEFYNYRALCGLNYVINLNNSTNTGEREYIVRAGYLENRLKMFEDLNVNFGARVDDYSNFGTEINPSFSFLYKLTEDYRLVGSISRSFRAPTFNDLYWPDEGWAVGNPDVRPEKGITEELGVEAELNKYISSSLTYYRNDYKDLINWAEENSVWKPKNVGSALINGVEFENKIYITNDLEFYAGYTFLRAKDDKTGKYLVYQPKHKVDCAIRYKDLNDLSFSLKAQFTDKRFHDTNNVTKVKSFFDLGLDISKKTKQDITYFVSINNLLDRKYVVIRDYPIPGFSVTSGMKFEF